MPLAAMHRFVAIIIVALGFAAGEQAVPSEDIISGEFDLVDHAGNAVNEHSFDGKFRLVFFGFTQCPDVCPTTLFEVRRALQLLGEDAEDVKPLFVSVDPENDTEEMLAAYVAAFHPSITGLTGSDEQIAAAAVSFNATYGINSASRTASGRDEVFHTAYLFLMDRDGDFIDVFGYGTKAEVIADAIRALLRNEAQA
jgi:protein SCO1/2